MLLSEVLIVKVKRGQGPSGDRCSMEGGDQVGANLIYIVSVMSLSLHRLTPLPT